MQYKSKWLRSVWPRQVRSTLLPIQPTSKSGSLRWHGKNSLHLTASMLTMTSQTMSTTVSLAETGGNQLNPLRATKFQGFARQRLFFQGLSGHASESKCFVKPLHVVVPARLSQSDYTLISSWLHESSFLGTCLNLSFLSL